MQEVRIQDQDLKDKMRHPLDYTGHFNLAEKKGYSGVGLYLKDDSAQITRGMGCSEFDPEGRIIRADYNDLPVISAYLPSGASGEEREASKSRFVYHFHQHVVAELMS